jgi:hypothetical protein
METCPNPTGAPSSLLRPPLALLRLAEGRVFTAQIVTFKSPGK